MATRHPRITVFGGAFASLVVMSILSAAMGKVILGLIPKVSLYCHCVLYAHVCFIPSYRIFAFRFPTLVIILRPPDIYQVWTLWAAALLFLAFGVRMIQEASSMQGGNTHIQEEMREVEEELEEDSSRHDTQNARGSTIPLEAMEEGKSVEDIPPSPSSAARRSSAHFAARASSPRGPNRGPSISFPLSNGNGGVGPLGRDKRKGGAGTTLKETLRNTIQLLTSPVFAQAFVLTFLGEWGDRSQITTIAMGAAHVSVPCGFIVHSCTCADT